MIKSVYVKNITIGNGIPKICVPMIGRTIAELYEEASCLRNADFDIVEWRVDFFKDVKKIEEVKNALKKIRSILIDVPIIFTLRSKKEGGKIEVSREFYMELNEKIVQTKLIDIVDIELFNDKADIQKILHIAHINSTAVIISKHDFYNTPSKDEILSFLLKEQQLGGDILKIAVMPNCIEDVITLLEATYIMKKKYAKRPLITISMGGKGIISRIGGEIFGSDITFAALKKTSAPGQIPLYDLHRVIKLLHSNLTIDK